jgi:topoisomerase IA-like protein
MAHGLPGSGAKVEQYKGYRVESYRVGTFGAYTARGVKEGERGASFETGRFSGRGAKKAAMDDIKRQINKRTACLGFGPPSEGEPCCARAGEYNGFGSDGPLAFVCPSSCPCHD